MVSQTKKVIDTYMIILSQCSQNMRRNHALAAFIVGIGSLRHVDLLANLSLCEIGVFS